MMNLSERCYEDSLSSQLCSVLAHELVIDGYATCDWPCFSAQLEFILTITFYYYTCKVMKSKQRPSHEMQRTTSTQHTRCSHLASALQLFRSSTSSMMQPFHQMVMLFMKWHIRYCAVLIIGFI
jgi:hypothetical protein